MSVISRTIPNLVSGVSQQPAALRLDSQCEAQVNGLSAAVEGLVKRPPARHRGKLTASVLVSPFVHFIDRDAAERYTVIVTNGVLKVYDRVAGAEKTVTTPDGTGYLAASDPRTAFVAHTIADHTFIANREIACAMDAALSATRGFEALVAVKAGNYASDFKISLYGKVVSFKRTESTIPEEIRTNKIASKLGAWLSDQMNRAWAASTAYTAEITTDSPTSLQMASNMAGMVVRNGSHHYICTTGGTSAGSGGPTGTGTGIADGSCVWSYVGPYDGAWTVTVEGSTIWARRATAASFEISVSDSQGGGALTLATTKIDDFSDLPKVAPKDFVTKVTGDADRSEDDYYVKFVPNVATAAFAAGSWEECVAPGVAYKFNAATMPHKLVRNGDGTFTFSRIAWGEREAGDAVTNADPSFIGRKITDIVFHRKRLCFTVSGGYSLSRAGNDGYYHFFRSTVTQLLDSDPIDNDVIHDKVVNIHHARSVPGGDLILFSGATQFIVTSGQDNLTPRTAEAIPITEYESFSGCAPASAGRSVFFVFEQDSYAGIREFIANQNDAAIKDAPEITGQVPRYVLAPCRKLAVSTSTSTLVAFNEQNKKRAFVYRYYWNDQQKLQSSWSEWEFSGDIIGGDFYGSELDLVIQYADGVYQFSLNLAPSVRDANSNYTTLLDRRITNAEATVAYNAGTDRTKFTLPFTPVDIDDVVIVTRAAGGGEIEGRVLLPVATGAAWIEVNKNHSATPVYIGEKYGFRYTFSEAFVKEEKGSGSVPITESVLRLQTWTINYADTGLFNVEVAAQGRDTLTYPFTGRVVGSSNNVLGQVSLESGMIRVPVRSRSGRVAVTVASDSFLPLKLLSAGWAGNFVLRSSRA